MIIVSEKELSLTTTPSIRIEHTKLIGISEGDTFYLDVGDPEHGILVGFLQHDVEAASPAVQ